MAPHSAALELSVIMPAYNEEATIEPVVQEHLAVLRNLGEPVVRWELVCLDDASTDGTGAILDQLAAQEPGLRVLHNRENAGIFAGFEHLAHAANGTHIYMTAADGQWPASNLTRLLRFSLEHQADLTIGVRTTKGKVYSLRRRLVSAAFNNLALLLFGVRTHDAGSIKFGIRELFTTELVSRGPFTEAERIIRASRGGFRVGFTPIEFGSRNGGTETGARWANVLAGVSDCLTCTLALRVAPLWSGRSAVGNGTGASTRLTRTTAGTPIVR